MAVRSNRQRGLVLPVVLIIITFLALLSVSFAFKVNAYRAGVVVMRDHIQLREAAESGMHHALLLLRENRHNPAMWYDNEPLFHNRVVWSELGDWADLDVPESLDPETVTYRYTLVADDPDDNAIGPRYGITDETSKLNINTASRRQIRRLFDQILPPEMDIAPLVAALIDWRDANNSPEPNGGAEQEYYALLQPPYTVKNGPLETVEELLLIKGFTANILYGEDSDRNGLLRPNEDDGERSFPPDNEDGILNKGIYPFITVYTRDLNRDNENVQRVDLNGDVNTIREELEELVSDEVIEYIVTARGNGVSFTCPVDLYQHSYTPGQNNSSAGNNSGGGGKKPDSSDGGNKSEVKEESPDNPAPPEPTPEGGKTGNDIRQASQNRPQNPGGTPGSTENGDSDEEPAEGSIKSPVEPEDLEVLCDVTTAMRAPGINGAININTAPREVLKCLVNDKFTDEDVEAILEARGRVDGERMATPAWLIEDDVISRDALSSIYSQVTARSQQFSLEVIGHADHTGHMVRLQSIIELRGHVPQFLYYRDISELGVYYPIRGVREGDEVGVRVRNR